MHELDIYCTERHGTQMESQKIIISCSIVFSSISHPLEQEGKYQTKTAHQFCSLRMDSTSKFHEQIETLPQRGKSSSKWTLLLSSLLLRMLLSATGE